MFKHFMQTHLGLELVAAQVMTPWLAKEEAVGNVFSAWPQSVVELLGGQFLVPVRTYLKTTCIKYSMKYCLKDIRNTRQMFCK